MIDGSPARSWLFTPGDRSDRFASARTRAATAFDDVAEAQP